ncbi:MAG: sugar phosphate isomerase/epimerase [Spirochaetaceae bacterium]
MENFKAINYWVLGGFEGDKTAFTAIDDAKKMGLDGIELTFSDVLKEDVTEEQCKEILEYATKQGVGLQTLATGYYWGCSLASEDVDEREKAIEFTKKYIKVAKWLNIDKILVVPGAVDVAWDESRPVTKYKTVWDNATKSINTIIPFAEENNVNICLENVWNKFLLSPMEFKFFLDQFDTEFIGIYFDVGNATMNGYPEHWVEILGSYIKAIHFKNFSREDCGGMLHGFGDDILEGDVNFKNVILELNKINYNGPITIEMIPFSRLPDLVLPDMDLAKKTANGLISILK